MSRFSRRALTVTAIAAAPVVLATPAVAYYLWTSNASEAVYKADEVGTPRNLTAVPSVVDHAAQVKLEWQAPTAPSGLALQYTVKRNGTALASCTAITALTCTDSGLTGGASVQYDVVALLPGTAWSSRTPASSASMTAPHDYYFVVTGAPSTGAAGTAFDVTVTARDGVGLNTAYAGQTRTLSITGTASPNGTSPAVGSAAFDSTSKARVGVRLFAARSTAQSFALSDATHAAASANVGPVTAGAAASLSFTTSPGGAVAGTAFTTQPVVVFTDAWGNSPVSTAVAAPALTIRSGTGTSGATLSGCTASATSTTSSVSFTGCRIDRAGTGYQLSATSGSLPAATSSSFTVSAGLTITSPTNGATNVGQKPTVSGNGGAVGSIVTLTFRPNGTTGASDIIRQATVQPNGTWSYSTTSNYLTNGTTYTLTATQGTLTSAPLTITA